MGTSRGVLVTLALAGLCACAAVPRIIELATTGDHRALRGRPAGARPSSPDKPPILYLALDGVGRDTLYALLREGKMPGLAKLLGGDHGTFPHAHFSERMLSTLPSSTMAAWVTTMSGKPPSEHGVTGNEYFVREDRLFACPAPVSFSSVAPTIAIYTESYLDNLSSVPTVYERMREKDPDLLVWVVMHEIYRGADKLLLARKTVLASAFESAVEKAVEKHLADKESMRVYKELDEGAIETVIADLRKKEVMPDVLTVYLSGTDLYAHVAEEGPDQARRTYLEKIVDPLYGRLAAALEEREALAGRWVVVGADHGHTGVMHDDTHALSKDNEDSRALLSRAGFRVRPFKEKVPENDPFSAVLAYGGAMAYVYLADRSGCADDKDVCDWKKPPRYEEDVLAVAEAFHHNDQHGDVVARMQGALDMILVRRPRPYAEVDLPFEVYLGGGKTMAVDAWLKENPHPTYVAVGARLRDLAAGVHGERAGDLLLLAHNGDRDAPDGRYYFAGLYHSWHGSPSKGDSELPFIVASSEYASAAIGAWVERVLGDRPFQQKTTDVLLGLREGALPRRIPGNRSSSTP